MRGAKHMLKQHHKKIAMFIAIDSHYGRISYGALGLRWFRFSFFGRSRHTTGSYRQPSAILAAARAITGIYRLRLPRRQHKRTWLNIGQIQGGEKPNRMAEQVSFTVDLRSPDKRTLDRLERRLKRLVRRAARKSRIRIQIKRILRFEAAQLRGLHRHKLVITARSVLKTLGVKRIKTTIYGSSDHCPAIAMGIPGINIGISKVSRFHQLDESVNRSFISKGLQQVVLLIAQLSQFQSFTNPNGR